VYDPEATLAALTISVESVSSRVISVGVIVDGEYTDTGLLEEDEGVRLMPTMGRLKLRMLVPVGGVSKIVMVTLALPLLLQLVQTLLTPLQEDNDSAAIATTSVNALFQFIEHPVAENEQATG
jgi:hypothetical protein